MKEMVIAAIIAALVWSGLELGPRLGASLGSHESRVVLYDGNGREIKAYTTQQFVSVKDGSCSFKDEAGMPVTIHGTFTVTRVR